jgi:triphosphatase
MTEAPEHFDAPDLRASASAGESLALIVQAAIRQVRVNEEGAHRGADTEYLHQWRVGLRRLRIVLGMPRAPECRDRLVPLRDRLRAFSNLLGEARNWDVFVLETLKPLAAAGADPGPRARALVARRRSAAYQAVETLVGSPDYVRVWVELSRMDWRAAVPAQNVRAFSREAMTRRHEGLTQCFCQEEDAASLHELRIAAKKLRYVCDAFGDLYPGGRARRYLETLSRVQTLLGEINDAATGREMLAKVYTDPREGDGKPMGMVLGWLAAAESRARVEYPKAIRKLRKIETYW